MSRSLLFSAFDDDLDADTQQREGCDDKAAGGVDFHDERSFAAKMHQDEAPGLSVSGTCAQSEIVIRMRYGPLIDGLRVVHVATGVQSSLASVLVMLHLARCDEEHLPDEQRKMTRLAQVAGHSTAAVTATVDRLEAHRLATRARCDDRRSVTVWLTDEGQAVMREVREQLNAGGLRDE